jgi:lincosamide nucleotidyltransferase B/F
MPTPRELLDRLDAIGRPLEQSGHALALIGMGSVGNETARLDSYSDLDFFAIVESGYKDHYIAHLDWLSTVCPVAFYFQNTADGFKLLFEDGIFCEFAVFEQHELQTIPIGAGRVIWKRPEIQDAEMMPAPIIPAKTHTDQQYLVGEALTNLFVGLGRFHRGEKLSAQRFIQQYAVNRILELANGIETERDGSKDPFATERRIEQRFPRLAQELPHFVQGYDRSPESGLAILEFLEQHFQVNSAMSAAIRERIYKIPARKPCNLQLRG